MTPDAAERRARALQRLREDTARRMDAMPTTHDDDVRTLIAAHDALADALRAAEARAVAAEGAIALLSRTLGCESDDPAGIVQEALDYAAETRERAEVYEESGDEPGDVLARIATAEAERDAAVTAHAALAGAVRAEREARAAVQIADDAQSRVATFEREYQRVLDDALRASATLDAARKHLDALLRGAPGGYVPVGAVREYLRARDAHAMPRPEATTAALRDDVIAARTALDAALLAATTTPKESL